MALVLEKVNPQGVVTRQSIDVGRNRFPAEPGFKYRIVDDAAQGRRIEAKARRIGNELVVEELPDQTLVEFEGFFSRCTPEQSCAVSMEELGGGAGAEITPASQPVAALTDGSFLMSSASPVASSITPMAAEGAGFGIKAAGLGLAGLGLVAAAGGGGGGGGGGGEASTPIVTQPLEITSAALTNDASPVLSGKATSNARIAVAISGPTITTVVYNTIADADGNWTLDLGTATPTSAATLPPSGLPSGVYNVVIRAIENNAATEVTQTIRIDTVTDTPTINAIGTDNLINAAERAAGVGVSGTAEANSTVTVSWGGATRTVTASPEGTWGTTFAAGEVPADGSTVVRASAVDALGNAAAVATRTVIVAANNPGVLIESDASAAGSTNRPVTFTFAFSEPVSGFDIADVVVSGGTAGALTQTGASSYALVVAPAAGVASGTMSVSVPAGAATNANGNATTASNVQSVTIDTVAPTLTISDNVAGTASGPVVFTFSFSEPVTGFTADDVNVTGGTKGAFTAIDSRTYTLTVTPSGSLVTVTVPPGAYADAAGNANTTTSTANQAFDNVAPVINSVSDSVPGTANGAIVFTFNFSEPISSFNPGGISVSNGSLGALNRVNSTTYTLTVNPTPGTTGNLDLTVGVGAYADAAGNANIAATTVSQPIDTQAPTVASITHNGGGTATGPVTFTITFNEAVSGLTQGELQVSGGTPSAFQQINATQYTVVMTPPADQTGTLSVGVPANVASDGAGNANTAGAGAASVSYSTSVPPTITSIVDSVPGATTNAAVTFTITFSEPVTGLTSGELAVTGGSVTSFTPVSSSVYNVVVTPTPGIASGTISVAVPAGVAQDAGGAGNLASTTATQAYDTLAPTLSISDRTAGTASGPVTYDFVFGESVSGFTLGDITITGGTASAGDLTGSGAAYALVVTPLSNSTVPIEVSVAPNAATDAAGNGNAAATAASQAVNTTTPAPVLQSVTDNVPASVTNGATTFTFTFDQSVTGFDAGDLSVVNGTVTSVGGSGAVWTALVTPTAGVNGAEMTVALLANSVTGTSTTGPTATSSPVAQAVDNVNPAQTALGAVQSAPTEVTITLDSLLQNGTFNQESVINFTRTDSLSIVTSLTWAPGAASFVDTTVTPGESYTYQATVVDLANNQSVLAPANLLVI